MSKKGMQYDYKKAYDKNLPMSERFHYLENARHDKDSAATFVDPTMASVGIDPQMTFQPPVPANQMGIAKPVFNPQVQGMAETIYGTPEQRQMSMPQPPVFMKDIPEGDDGAGLRALDDSVVENMGYDAATKMVSPLGMHHKYKAPEVDPYFRNPGGNANITKTLTKKPKKTTGLRRAASVLTGGLSEVASEVVERVRDYNNPPQQNFTKVKTEMPKKRANGGHDGYVVSTTTGERIPTETIPQQTFTQAQNILKRQPQNIWITI
jgi:hypothetical protein